MRVVVVAGAVVACTLCVARAQTPPAALVAPTTSPEYPLAITDRPVLLYPGMTELDLSENFPTYTKTTVDTMGNVTTTRTGLTDHRTPALNVAHAFGPVEVSAGLGQLAGAEVSLNTGVVPAVLSLSVSSSFLSTYQDPNYYYDRQAFGVGHKVHVVPGQFAVYGGGSVSLIEHASTLDNAMIRADHIVWVSVRATAELQLTSRLGIYAGASLGAPASESSSHHDGASLGFDVELLLAAFRKWDFYGAFGLSDLNGADLPYLSFGFAKRWGI